VDIVFEGITLGAYIPGDSLLHKFDPRVKIIGSLLLIAGTLLVSSPAGILIYSITALLLLVLSHLSWSRFFKGLRFIYVIVALSLIIQSFSVPGEVLWQVGSFNITREGIFSGALLSWRLLVIVILSSLVTYTTTSINLSAGLERMLRPLERLGLPVSQLAMMMGITISFIPLMLEEFQSVITAQQSRGAGFGSRNLIRQFKNLLPLLLPVVAGILRRADELSEAMEARCYRPGAHRSRMRELCLHSKDWTALAVTATMLAVVVLLEYKFLF
jgi:energy-coupling factor transport system permease protein